MTDELEPKLIADLLGMFAHDLRNPLSALGSNLGFVGSLVDTTATDAEDALRDSIASCDSLLRIIDNLELLAHELSGGKALALAPVALGPLATEVVKKAEAAAASHGVAVELAFDPALGKQQVLAHRDMLSRALSNLVRNAIQHGASGAPVHVSLRVDAGEGVISIVDSGAPLDPALRDQAFSAAGQLDVKNLAGGRYGRGLGLYAARVAANAAGARVGAGACADGRSELLLSAPLVR